MYLEEHKEKRKRKRRIKSLITVLILVLLAFGVHKAIQLYHGSPNEDGKSVIINFKDNEKNFISNDIDLKNTTKKTIKQLFDFVKKGSEFVDKNISQPVVEISKELADEMNNQTFSENETDTSVFEGVTYEEVSENKQLTHISYWSSIDGDTIKVLDEATSTFYTVRLIGVNSPESVHPDEEKNNEYGKMASTFTEEYLDNYVLPNHSDLWLSFDTETVDQYGRMLAYVWISDNVDINNEEDIENYMYNAILLKNGYAKDVVYEPNHKYKDVFRRICNDAEENGAGLWAYSDIYNYY